MSVPACVWGLAAAQRPSWPERTDHDDRPPTSLDTAIWRGQVEDAVRRFFGLGHEQDPDDTLIDLPTGFEPVGWIGQRSSIIEVRGVRIPPGHRVRALLNLQTDGPLPPGAMFRAGVQQAVNGQLAGGSTFVVRVAGR